MKKTFDQLFSEIVGENIMQPTKPATTPTAVAQNTTQQTQQPAQPSTPQQGQDIKTLSAQLAKLTDANEIEKVLAQLLNPNAANKPA